MKIIYILKRPFGNIASSASYQFPTIMKKFRHDVIVVSPSAFNQNNDQYDIVFRNNSLNIIAIPANMSLKSKISFINNIIKKNKPDIIHVFFDQKAYLYPLYYKISNPLNRIKWIIDIRSPLISSLQKSTQKGLTSLIKQLFFDAIIGHEKHSINDRFEKVFKPTYIVPPGVDMSLFKRTEIGEDVKTVPINTFVYIGSITHTRKLDVVIRSIKDAVNRLSKHKNLRFDFYGSGNATEHIEKLIKDSRLENIINFHGLVPQEELFKKLPSYDVGLAYIPDGTYYHAPSLKTLEYMASSLFVIGSNTNGNRKYIIHGYNGILVDNTSESYANAIVDAVNNGLPNIFRKNARKVSEQHDWGDIVKNMLIPVYRKLIN